MKTLESQSVLVVGGSSGIGAATARAFSELGAQVNTVSPGLIATPLWSSMPEKARSALFEAAAARLPAARTGRPEDVANAIVYLATTGFATGSTVLVDGGDSIA